MPEQLQHNKEMSISKHYDPQQTEDKWYAHWMEKNYFRSTPDEREPFTIVIPPPNVTGMLHMGHMLNNTIQDVLIRKARLEGKNACWVPGTDHASIATEAKVVRMLREQGIKKSDLTREEFLDKAWEWKEKYGGIILKQLRKLGASCDWERTRFTMEDSLSKAVLKTFVDLYKKDKVYRGLRMVNWDPKAQTVLSNEEVLYKDKQRKLYKIRYQIEGTDEWLTVATTRPETIMGDTAVAVNPKDERYTHLAGKKAILPLIHKAVPIIFDSYVDMEFGTGALKVTPAHDINDYEIGLRHNLEVIDVLNDDATLSEAAQIYIGEDRFKARKLAVADLEAAGQLEAIDDYQSSVGYSERNPDTLVEPKLSLQWYVRMEELAKPALDAVMNDEIKFHPPKYKNTYNHWMSNVRPWCISRQLWWGQRIPAWYLGDDVFVGETAEEALEAAKKKTGNAALTIADLRQDEDVFDTWFSSWLWPISVFDGFERRDELDYYYPTNVLVTGWDIIFLWVARMIIVGYEWEGKMPFKHVYFTGMVKDEKRRKMSKSLGNSPDALELIERFGADGVRFGMLSCSPAGGDLLFDEKLCENGRNFTNKIWNALRLVRGWEITNTPADAATQKANELAINWIENKFNQVFAELESNIAEFRLSEALMSLYTFIWGDFCSWYLEMIKPVYGQPIDRATYDKTIAIFEKLMTTLHPFMPFLTEEVWHQLRDRAAGEDCVISQWYKAGDYDKTLIKNVELATEIVSKVRDLRQQNQMSPKEAFALKAQATEESKALLADEGLKAIIIKLANLEDFVLLGGGEEGVSFISGATEYHAMFERKINVEEERKKINEELKRLNGFVAGIGKKLSNERFVSNAPEAVVAKEKQKLADGQARIKILEEQLTKLG